MEEFYDDDDEVEITLRELDSLMCAFCEHIYDVMADTRHEYEEGIREGFVGHNKDDENDVFRIREYAKMLWQLEGMATEIEYIQKDIEAEGVLHIEHAKSEHSCELILEDTGEKITLKTYSSFNPIEVLLKKGNKGKEEWVYDNLVGLRSGKFILENHPRVDLEGKTARIRE